MRTFSSVKTNICSTLILLMVVVSFVQCQRKKISRVFFVDKLGLYINIEEITFNKKGTGKFRINIYKSADHIGDDYIEIDYTFSEMPSISLNFPSDESNKIHVIDRYQGEVKYCKSTNFNIIYPKIDNNNLKELDDYQEWCDSVMYETPSINVRLNSGLRNLTIWNNDAIYLGDVQPFD